MYRIAGKLTLPKPGASFALALGLPDRPVLPIAQTLTEKDGSFQFAKVPSGTYDLFAAGPVGGYGEFDSILGKDPPLFGRMRVQVTGQNVEGLDLPLTPPRSVGVVLRAPGSASPPAGCPQTASLKLTSLEPWGMMFNASGQAEFGKERTIPDLAPGRFRASAEGLGAGCYQVNQPVADLSGDASNLVVVELAAAGSVRGALPSGGEGFTVVLLDPRASEGVQAQLAFPDPQGNFEFRGLRPGRYRIAAQPTAEAARARWIANVTNMTEIDVRGGPPTVIELSPGGKGARP